MNSLQVVQLLHTYRLPVILLGAFFFGETVILSAAFLAVKGVWSVAHVFWLALIGTMCADLLWFLGGRYFQRMIQGRELFQKKYSRHYDFLVRMTKIPSLSLLFYKFLYGTRILTILFLAFQRLRLRPFILYNLLGTIIWLWVMIAIGWSAGQGAVNLFPFMTSLKHSFLLLLALIAAAKLISLWISRKISKS